MLLAIVYLLYVHLRSFKISLVGVKVYFIKEDFASKFNEVF